MEFKKIKYGDDLKEFTSLIRKNQKVNKYFFQHEVEFIEKQYSDMFLIMGLRGFSKKELFKGKFLQINIYSKEIEGLPDNLFFDKKIIWHQQHFGKKGLIASAGLYLPNQEDIFIEVMQSDLLQQLFRTQKFRKLYRTKLEDKYKYWYKILFNAVLDFAIGNGFLKVYCPTSEQLSNNTKMKVDNSFFTKVYDYSKRNFNSSKKKIKKAEYWKIDLKKNLDKIVRLKPLLREIKKSKKIVCIYHDIEEDVDTQISKEKCKEYLQKMLEIEKKQGISVTYNLLGSLFNEKEKIIQSYGNHSISFHSYDHNLKDLNQLKKVREVNLQVRGYRPPQSKLTRELNDYNLSYHNFEWLMSSASSLNTTEPKLENGIVKIPLFIDDFPLHKMEISYERWENNLLETIKNNDFVAFGTHDCYGYHWIGKYNELINKLKARGCEFRTCDEISNYIFLEHANSVNFYTLLPKFSFKPYLNKLLRTILSEDKLDSLYNFFYLGKYQEFIKKRNRLLKENKVIAWEPNLNKVEIEITTDCNLACFNCDRSCRQAPSKEKMSLEQIRKFVSESINLNYKWNNIAIIGGEPTLHPQIFEILGSIKKYKDFNPDCRVEIVTHGLGKVVNQVLSELPGWIIISNSNKKSNIQYFSSYNLAPFDLKRYQSADFLKGCEVTEECGLGLTRYGYYPCGAGAAVDRVFGFDIGIKRLSDINMLSIKGQLKSLCKYCGHYKDKGVRKFKGINEEKFSESWQKAYKKYKEAKPIPSLY